MKTNTTFKLLTLGLIVASSVPMAANAALYRELQVGSRGADVSELQTYLANDPSLYPQGLITGYYGSLTRAAVIRYQRANGISQVGRVGPQTMASLMGQMNGNNNSNNNNNTSGIAPTFTSLSLYPTSAPNPTGSERFTFTTDIPSQSDVHYSTSKIPATENEFVTPATISIGGSIAQSDASFKTSHVVDTGSLNLNTRYYYIIHAMSANGESSVRSGQFTTSSY